MLVRASWQAHGLGFIETVLLLVTEILFLLGHVLFVPALVDTRSSWKRGKLGLEQSHVERPARGGQRLRRGDDTQNLFSGAGRADMSMLLWAGWLCRLTEAGRYQKFQYPVMVIHTYEYIHACIHTW